MSEVDPARRFLVVDASVSLKWVLNDEDAVPSAAKLRNDAHEIGIQLLAPSLWIYEVTNALAVARIRGRIDSRQSHRALHLLRNSGVLLVDPEPEDCLETSLDLEISGYDAAYVALAATLQADLWTGDRRLVTKASVKSSRVHWIGDYPREN